MDVLQCLIIRVNSGVAAVPGTRSTVSQLFKYFEHRQPFNYLAGVKVFSWQKNPPPLFLSRYQVRRSELVALFIFWDLVNLRT